MKKLFLSSLSALLLFSFNSCLSTNESTPSGVEGGIFIYNQARFQVDMDIDPLILALKLNTLIETSDQLFEDYSVAKVTVDEKEVVLVDLLFGEGNTVTRNGDEWVLVFKNRTAQNKEKYYRDGEIVIDTKGLLLQDLADDPAYGWDITVTGEKYEMSFITGDDFANRIEHYTITGSPSGENSWVAKGRSTSYYMAAESAPADWDFEYELSLPGSGSFYYEDILNSQFILNCDITGTPVMADFKVNYNAVDLKYKPRCDLWYVYGGTENVEILDRAKFTEEELPELYVKYNWFDYTYSSECLSAVEISYNGNYITV